MKPALQDIDAETQIFTPQYVAKYLAQNSIGRLWINSKPHTSLIDKLGMYVASPNPQNLARVASPEEIRIIDPACGTGNLLTAAFDVLFEIYLDAGYKPAQIPALILRHNLVGRDIDPDAAAAAKAILVAKAHETDSHFFRHRVDPDVHAFTDKDHPDAGLFGTLIRDLDTTKYHVVLANPPYMGSKHFTPKMSAFARREYADSRGDLCTMFMERGLEMLVPGGMISMITMQSWMFLSSFETLRKKMLTQDTILTMAHLGYGVFGPGAVISTTAFVITNLASNHLAVYFRLVDSKHKQRDLHISILNYRGQQEGVPVLPPTPGSPLVEPQEMKQGTLPLWGQEAA